MRAGILFLCIASAKLLATTEDPCWIISPYQCDDRESYYKPFTFGSQCGKPTSDCFEWRKPVKRTGDFFIDGEWYMCQEESEPEKEGNCNLLIAQVL